MSIKHTVAIALAVSCTAAATAAYAETNSQNTDYPLQSTYAALAAHKTFENNFRLKEKGLLRPSEARNKAGMQAFAMAPAHVPRQGNSAAK